MGRDFSKYQIKDAVGLARKQNLFDYKLYKVKSGRIRTFPIDCPILMFDIVSFSENMDNDTMYSIINAIQDSMTRCLDTEKYFWAEQDEDSDKNNLLFVSTGDGYAIAVGNTLPDSEVLQIAVILYKAFIQHALNFRMSIVKGRNILSLDMNNTVNIFGYGMVLATRVCDKANNGQILIEKTFGKSLLQQRKIPELQLLDQQFEAKHEFKFECYNYFDKDGVGMDMRINSDYDIEKENIEFAELTSNLKSKKIVPNKKYWSYRDIFNDDSDFIHPKFPLDKKIRKILWSDMSSEYDSKHLYNYIKSLKLNHSADFDNVFQLWLIDENNHYLGFRKLFELINPITEAEENELITTKPNFEGFKQIFTDEFSILLALAYDELATVHLYNRDLETYQVLGMQATNFIKKVVSDEGSHYGKFIALLKEYHSNALSNMDRVKKILDQIIKLDGNPYQRTFILDHSRDVYNAEISALVKEIFIKRIEHVNTITR